MKKKEPIPVVLMNFSGSYESQQFYNQVGGIHPIWCDFQKLSGTNCYCDEDSQKTLLEGIKKLPLRGIHFLDSGNYHYMTRLWMEGIEVPFRLLVFDNHTDLQPPAFGKLLSCGGWLANALEEVANLREVFLIGPEDAAYRPVDPDKKQRIRLLKREEIAQLSDLSWRDYFASLPMDLPWYLSIDKDILSSKDVTTNWSQGDLRLLTLLEGLHVFFERCFSQGGKILGIDVCGEADLYAGASFGNDQANHRLLEELITIYAQ